MDMRKALVAMALMMPASSALAQETACDQLAGYRLIPRVEGAAGVYAISQPEAAVTACLAERTAHPDDPWFAVLLARARLAADPADGRAVGLLRGAMEALPALASAELGRLYETGQGALPTGDRQARDFYTAACDAWPDRVAAPGCTRLAVMKIEGRGGPADEAGGFALLDNLCRSGWGTACLQQAFQTDLHAEGDFDEISRQIVTLFEAGCEGGDLLACSQFGYRLELGDGVTHDPARAQALYRQACDGGEPQGCSYLGEIYRSGLGVQPDMVEAVRLFRLGCAGSDPYACVTLGDILSEGRGVEVNLPEAIAALDHACWLGDPEACDMADGLR
ncbi:sel1 repeat family protein [Cereibacter sphaeroides]|nr:sel1 repeat family protein [Cereibacter sphaeroides]